MGPSMKSAGASHVMCSASIMGAYWSLHDITFIAITIGRQGRGCVHAHTCMMTKPAPVVQETLPADITHSLCFHLQHTISLLTDQHTACLMQTRGLAWLCYSLSPTRLVEADSACQPRPHLSMTAARLFPTQPTRSTGLGTTRGG